jgi:hypothetical protein
MNPLPEDLFDLPEFKVLPWYKRFWIRLKVAFFTFNSYM